MRKGLFFGAVMALSLGAPVFAADELSYNYVDVGILHSSFDDLDADGDGAAIEGSLAFTDRIFGFAGYAKQDFDLDIDASSFELGAGLRFPLSAKWDLIGTGSYINLAVDAPFVGEVKDDGLGLGIGLRGRASEHFELTGGVNYVTFDEGGDNTSLAFGARYFFNDLFALGADVDFDEDETTYLLGARFNFGRK